MAEVQKILCAFCKIENAALQIVFPVNICKKCYIEYNEESYIVWEAEINEITENIFLGNDIASKNLDLLQKNNITHILVVGSILKCHFPDNFIYKQIHIYDSEQSSIKKYFQECISFIKTAKKIFVHCQAGQSRSPSIVIAFLMKENNMRFEDAFALVKKKRKLIMPNRKFIAELKQYGEELEYSKL